MEHHAGLLDGTDHIAADDLIACLGHRREVPLLLPAQRGDLDTAGDIGARLLHDLLQRALDAVVNILDQAGAQLHRQGGAGGDHLGAGAQAGRLLIDLDGGGVPVHVQDLADQTLLAHADHVGHIRVLHPGGDDQRAGNLDNLSAQCFNLLSGLFSQTPAPAGRPGARGRAAPSLTVKGYPRPRPAPRRSSRWPCRCRGSPPCRG